MAFFGEAINTLKILVIALGAGHGAWGLVNLLKGYGNDNPGVNAPGAWRSNRKSKKIDGQRIGNV